MAEILASWRGIVVFFRPLGSPGPSGRTTEVATPLNLINLFMAGIERIELTLTD